MIIGPLGLDDRCHENHSTFFSLVPRGKEEKSKLKVFIFDFRKQVGESSTFLRYCVKNNYISAFQKLHEKWVLPFNFSFVVTSSSWDELEFSKVMFFRSSASTKNDPVPLKTLPMLTYMPSFSCVSCALKFFSLFFSFHFFSFLDGGPEPVFISVWVGWGETLGGKIC